MGGMTKVSVEEAMEIKKYRSRIPINKVLSQLKRRKMLELNNL